MEGTRRPISMLEGGPPKTRTNNNIKKNITIFKEKSNIRILQYDNTSKFQQFNLHFARYRSSK